MKFLPLVIIAVTVISGCQTNETDAGISNTGNICADGASMLSSKYLSDWQKAAVFEKMKGGGCFS